MGVMVYPLLGELLRDRNMTVADLERDIVRRYGITVERGALERLMQPVPVRRTDMEMAGAVAKALDIGLDGLFDVRAVGDGQGDGTEQYLSRSEASAMARLLDRQDEGTITDAEQQELDALIAKQAQLVTEKWLHEIAADHGQSVEKVRAEIQTEVQRVHKEWLDFLNDPDKQAEARERAKSLPKEWSA